MIFTRVLKLDSKNWNYEIFWNETVKRIQSEITEQEYMMWFKNMHYSGSEKFSVIISVPSSFYKDQIIQRYQTKIEDTLLELSGETIKLEFVVNKRNKDKKHIKSTKALKTPDISIVKKKPKHPQLNSEYIFDRFVIGDSNSFAANAAYSISKNPGKGYNPCLIYGGVGLGKTHLIQAIGNSAYQEFDNLNIAYITAETFANEFILSIQKKTGHLFKNKYRSIDILLIDDIHFLQGKEGTQEELFHTFNALYDSNKQMVFTSDRPVSELRSLSDRLRSRFERGLNVDLQPPDYETRVAILKKKIEEKEASISNDIIELICKNIKTNVRDLEKALTKLLAYSELVNKNITLETAQRQLQDFFTQPNQKNITIDNIQRVVAEYFNLSYNDLKGKKRTKAIAFPRQVAMYIARDLTEYSTTEIGLEFGGRDHTTVMHACQRIEDKLKIDATLEPAIQHIIRALKGYGIQ